MTLGQNIARCRAALGLSQGALAEELGVSRQSVSKWETDAALPEIDKLIALSRLFGQPIGALLGVEDASDAPQEASDELSEQQLKMVEEITRRYIEAIPAPPKPKKRWRILAVLLILFACYTVYNKLEQTENQYENLRYQMDNVQQNVGYQISGISNRVEEILKQQNNLTADYETAIADADLVANTVTFSFRAVPKTFTASTVGYLEVTNEGAVETFGPFTPAENQTFTGEVTTALTDDIILSVIFEDGGVRQTQLLDEYQSLYSQTLPSIWFHSSDLWLMQLGEPNVFTIPSKYNEGRYLDIRYGTLDPGKPLIEGQGPIELVELKVGIFKNQKLLAWAKEVPKPDRYQGDWEDCRFFEFPDIRTELTNEDTISYAAVGTDSYGRTVFYGDEPYSIHYDIERYPNGHLDRVDGVTRDSNIENWTF